jgi:hypothetical protein
VGPLSCLEREERAMIAFIAIVLALALGYVLGKNAFTDLD